MKVKLGDLTKIRTGKLDANASTDDGAYPFFTCSREPLKISSYSYDCECVLVAGNGDLNVKYYNGKFDAYQRTYIIEAKQPDVLYMPYLYYFMEKYIVELRKLAIGGVIKYIKLGNLTDAFIELPSYNQQRSLVERLEKVKSAIDKRNEQLEKLDELVKCRFVELFGDPVTNSGNWETRTIEQICENLDYKRKPISSEKRVSGIYPYYGASGIVDYVDGYIFAEPLLLISEDGANLLARSTPIAFSVDGKIWVNNHAHVLKFNDIASQKYVEALFSMIDISHLITGSAQPKLNQEKLNTFSIPWPPIHLQVQYNQWLHHIDKLRVSIQASLDKTQQLFDSLMQEYFD